MFLLAAALFLRGAADAGTVSYFLQFGATPTSPIGRPVPRAHATPGHELCPYFEPDYVPNYEAVVPQVIRSCGASFIRFETLTEGAERAFFDIATGQESAAVECIKLHVPQGHVETAAEKLPR